MYSVLLSQVCDADQAGLRRQEYRERLTTFTAMARERNLDPESTEGYVAYMMMAVYGDEYIMAEGPGGDEENWTWDDDYFGLNDHLPNWGAGSDTDGEDDTTDFTLESFADA